MALQKKILDQNVLLLLVGFLSPISFTLAPEHHLNVCSAEAWILHLIKLYQH
jgi:hypothetical protein